MKKLVALAAFLVVFAQPALAGFGGARAGGFSSGAHSSSFSSGRSSFGGSRSSYSAPISRPAPIYRAAPAAAPVHTTTNVYHGSSGGGSGFTNGLLLGTVLNGNHGGTTVVQGAPAQVVTPDGSALSSPPLMVVQAPEQGFISRAFWFLLKLFGVILMLGFIFAAIAAIREAAHD